MAPRKPHIARTYAPIHFDDLEPHRFEDLVRELIYDFKEWQSIEATGRAGSDDGFDIRAFEKVARVTPLTDDDDEDDPHPMEGRRWMIQGKREKTIGPTNLKKILADVDENDPPYGYILAASAVFSKKSYDVFREILRMKGVMEFYIWSSSELEDMLHLPKNDRILFTFFGISLISRHRSLTTEARNVVIVKNKLHKILGGPSEEFSTPVLIRDINDTLYPYKSEYPDFSANPRWVAREAFSHDPRGFWVHRRKHYAYVDRDFKEWDFTDYADLLYNNFAYDDEEDNNNRLRLEYVKQLIDYLPRSKQGEFQLDGIVLYNQVLLVDAEGDGRYPCPHIYIDFLAQPNGYAGTREYLLVGKTNIEVTAEWKRIDYFKSAAPIIPNPPTAQAERMLDLDSETLKDYHELRGAAATLYAIDDRYRVFQRGDIVHLRDEYRGKKHYFQIMHVQMTTLDEYLRYHPRPLEARHFAARQIGRPIESDEILTIVETDPSYPYQWEKHSQTDRDNSH
jgi:hypothetical protein